MICRIFWRVCGDAPAGQADADPFGHLRLLWSRSTLSINPVQIEPVRSEVYRPRLVRHRIACYAARAAGESWFWRMAAGVWNPCRSMSQVVL